MINKSLLDAIPADCGYDEWLKVGMALKHEGADWTDWDDWSRKGSKYKQGECERKWKTFRRSEVTGGTLFHIATQYGYVPEKDDTVYDIHNLLLDEIIVDPSFVSEEKIPPVPRNYDGKGEILEYLTTLFEADDFIGYCVNFFKDEKGDWRPGKTNYRRTAGNIIDQLRNGSTIETALGTLNPEAGAYIRFNPLDGKGENNSNVTRWKYCLIESDTDSVERQYALLKEMNLPITFLISSGKKSLHAITRVDAENPQQYKHRVRELYEFCEKNGFTPDAQDKNESRFSRLPGIKRGSKWQYIVERNIGAGSYSEWIEWRESQADDLPSDCTLADVWNNLPPLKDELIPGVLRVGHKLLLAGPSKAGKSFMLINLAISIAEGIEWIGLKCKQGKVCYVNLELDYASCFQRFKDIYEKRGIEPRNLSNITIWNLRGHAAPMDRLASILIRRFRKKNYSAVIIDPIYKVITGDENNATEMSRFCSYFDQVAAEMETSVIYCHHHSKGATGKYANSADRSSGSGVFARDPDAILDLRELKTDGLTGKYRAQHENACDVLTAWELSGTLREFAPVAPRRIWFDHPIHVPDEENFLAVATFNDSSRGTGKNQKEKTDWFAIVDDLLGTLVIDTAIDIESVGISKSNAGKTFTKETDYEVATVGGVKAVHRRDEDEIIFRGKTYRRKPNGLSYKWVPNSELQNPL